MLHNVLHGTRLLIATIIGWSLVALGLVMLVTPGPGLLALAAGTAVLARHFDSVARLRAAAGVRIARLAAGGRRAAPAPSAGQRPAAAPEAGDLTARSAA